MESSVRHLDPPELMIQVQAENLNIVRVKCIWNFYWLDIAAHPQIALFDFHAKGLRQPGFLNPAPGRAFARVAAELVGDDQEVTNTEEMVVIESRRAV